MANPMPERRSSSRRVSEQSLERSIDIHHLIGQQQQLSILLPGGELRAFRMSGIGRIDELTAHCQLFTIRHTTEDKSVESGDSGVVILGSRHFGPSSESLRLLDEEWGIHQKQ